MASFGLLFFVILSDNRGGGVLGSVVKGGSNGAEGVY